MGHAIENNEFTAEDFARYEERLRAETQLLARHFEHGSFSSAGPVAGMELEAWLIDHAARPTPKNEAFLDRLADPLVVMELAQFNVELNAPPLPLTGGVLSAMRTQLEEMWRRCNEVAATLDAEMLMCGILPTLRESDLTLATMSPKERYRALNEQVLRQRNDSPITLDIQGRDHLRTTHHDVMLEAAATSFQLHLQVPADQAVRFYNASVALSAPMLAASANSPFAFGHDLWDETRIPLFEQSVAMRRRTPTSRNRVTLGSGYMRESLMECFAENLEHYPVLLPELSDESPARLRHLRMLNGTIWRWNRPLIGFDKDGSPHLRIEHRVMPAGPSVPDSIANAALYYGLVHALATAPVAPESLLTFEQARENFYAAARDGFRAEIVWLDGSRMPARDLLAGVLLPLARRGMEALDLAPADIALYHGIFAERVRLGMNGAEWQRAHVRKYGADMAHLAGAYRDRQRGGAPVHEWAP